MNKLIILLLLVLTTFSLQNGIKRCIETQETVRITYEGVLEATRKFFESHLKTEIINLVGMKDEDAVSIINNMLKSHNAAEACLNTSEILKKYTITFNQECTKRCATEHIGMNPFVKIFQIINIICGEYSFSCHVRNIKRISENYFPCLKSCLLEKKSVENIELEIENLLSKPTTYEISQVEEEIKNLL
jgi:hypothetical protein